ncbi:MAG: replicative DNA helicase [Bacilli bacterium]|nr:replicative DNA helicase [Bacilli bacterium]
MGEIMVEKVMPHNLDAERSVLGSMFLSKYALQKAAEILSSDLFYLDAHGKIFTVFKDLLEKSVPIDLTIVTEELQNRNWLKQIGDVDYLAEVINSVPTAANVDEYIKIVNEKAILRRLIEEATNIVAEGYTSSEELGTVLDNAEKKILNVVKTRKGTEFKKIQDVLLKAQADLDKLSQTRGEITGLATGYYDLDKITSGLHANELIIIAARPAMGKTAFALNLAINIAQSSKKGVAIFNMEMGAEQLANRMIASVGQIELNKLISGNLQNNDWKRINEAISRLSDTKIFIDDTPGMTIGEIRAKCRRLDSSEDGIGIVIIDYLQLISGSARYAGNRQQEVAEISRSLKTLAMELEIPVVALAQLSRSVEGRDDKRPLLSDLRESGSIEQDADIVAFLYRDDYYTKEISIDENTSKSEFIVAKNRSGPTKTVDLIFKRNTSTFVNMANRDEEES